MAAKTIVNAAQAIVARDRHQFARLLRIEPIDAVAHFIAHAGDEMIMVEIVLVGRDDHALGRMLGRIAEQFVHHRPQPLFFEEQRALVMAAPAAIAARGLRANDTLVEHEHAQTVTRQPPGR